MLLTKLSYGFKTFVAFSDVEIVRHWTPNVLVWAGSLSLTGLVRKEDVLRNS